MYEQHAGHSSPASVKRRPHTASHLASQSVNSPARRREKRAQSIPKKKSDTHSRECFSVLEAVGCLVYLICAFFVLLFFFFPSMFFLRWGGGLCLRSTSGGQVRNVDQMERGWVDLTSLVAKF